MRALTLAALFSLFFGAVAPAQTVTYWQGGYGERWTSPGNVITHFGAIKPCAVGASDDLCPRSAGWGEGIFHLNGHIYVIVGGKRIGPNPGDPNYQGDIRNYNTDPAYIGDHLDCYIRYDSDGTYDRTLDFVHLPANRDMHTLSDSSVRQEDSPLALPAVYNGHATSQGTDWQIGSGFTAFVGPRLDTDPASSHRVYAFFPPESYPGDQGVGGHMIGFASVNVLDSATTFGFPPSSIWKDATSPNDGDYKLNSGIPLRTLYLREFTPLVAFRGDAGLWSTNDNPLLDSTVKNGRYVGGMSGWYTNGYFYVLIGVTLSTDTLPPCTNANYPGESHPVYKPGLLLMRIKADPAGTQGFGGLWLDGTKKPQVSFYRVSGANAGQWVTLPAPDQLVSFQEDEKSWGCVGGYNRLYYLASGASLASGNNPREYGSHFNILYPPNIELALPQPSGVFTLSDECTHYVVVANWPEQLTTARILRVSQPNCTAGGTTMSFSHAAQIDYPSPGTIDGIQYDDGGSWPGWPDIIGFDNGSWLGFRTAADGGLPDGSNSVASFTVMPDLLNCSFQLNSSATTFGANGGSGSVILTSPEGQCLWSAQSDAGFATITSASNGHGTTTVAYSVATNTSGFTRTAHLTLGDQTYTITQTMTAPAAVSFSLSTYSTLEKNGTVTLTVTRGGGDTSGAASTTFSTANGTAIAGVRYSATTTTVSFAAGETSKTVNVPLLNTGTIEGKQTFTASLSSPVGTSLGLPSTASVDILDDDTVGTDFSSTLDGKRDMVWRNNTTGNTRVWLMNNTVPTSAFSLSSNSTQLTVAGVADFNGDGHADIVWRNSSDGTLSIWYMNGASVVSTASMPSIADTQWFVAAVGDLNADGYPDLLWRNSVTFQDVVWLMRNTTQLSTAALPTVNDVNWKVIGIGDFNRDHKNDIVWRNNATTDCAVWLMDGTTFTTATFLPKVGAPWLLVGVGDMNGDGDADLIWQTTTTHQVALWQMNQTSFGTAYFLDTSIDSTTANDPQWAIVAPR